MNIIRSNKDPRKEGEAVCVCRCGCIFAIHSHMELVRDTELAQIKEPYLLCPECSDVVLLPDRQPTPHTHPRDGRIFTDFERAVLIRFSPHEHPTARAEAHATMKALKKNMTESERTWQERRALHYMTTGKLLNE